jgi:hypothetical protein
MWNDLKILLMSMRKLDGVKIKWCRACSSFNLVCPILSDGSYQIEKKNTLPAKVFALSMLMSKKFELALRSHIGIVSPYCCQYRAEKQ